MRKPTIWFPNSRLYSHRSRLEALNFIEEEEELYYPCSENKGPDRLHGYCEADLTDLRLCFCINILLVFS